MSAFRSTASAPDRRPVSIPTTGASETATPHAAPGPSLTGIDPKPLPQYSLGKILAVWAGAALPMAAMAWVVAPVLAGAFADPTAWPKALALSLTAGLIWQFVLVLLLVHREQGTLRWSVLKDALWLRAPRSPRTGRRGGWLWLLALPSWSWSTPERRCRSWPLPSAATSATSCSQRSGRTFSPATGLGSR